MSKNNSQRLQRSNSQRFIAAYNVIDACLRSVYNYNDNISFTDLIRRCAEKNYVVRSNETDLVDYARLRNAIVHKSTPEMVIAEPHDNVVGNFERIAKLICTPPKARVSIKEQKLITLNFDAKILDAVKLITKSHYSNIPVYKDRVLKGIVNNKLIVNVMGEILLAGENVDSFLKTNNIGSILEDNYFDAYYKLCSSNATMEEIINLFTNNRRLIAVIMTKGGTKLETPIGIITAANVLEFAEILDNYQ